MYGTAWAKVSACFEDVSADAARKRWAQVGDEVCEPPDSIAAPTPLEVLALPKGQRLCWPPLEQAMGGREGRDRTGGRSWDYFVSRAELPSREPSKRQLMLLRLWCVDPPFAPLVMCNLGRAESIVRRYPQLN